MSADRQEIAHPQKRHPIDGTSCFVAVVLFFAPVSILNLSTFAHCQDAAGNEPAKVIVDSDGTVQVPDHSVPPSSFLSPEAKAYVTEHLKQMQDPEIVKQDQGIPRFMKPFIERDQVLFAVDRKEERIGECTLILTRRKQASLRKTSSES